MRAKRGGQHAAGDTAAWRELEDRDVCGDWAGGQQLQRFGRVQVDERTVEKDEIGYMAGRFDDSLERRVRLRYLETRSEELPRAHLERSCVGVGDEHVGRPRRDVRRSRRDRA